LSVVGERRANSNLAKGDDSRDIVAARGQDDIGYTMQEAAASSYFASWNKKKEDGACFRPLYLWKVEARP
jgi:hypothetical protein